MSQILSQVMGQQMRLEQKLTPQLIQSMDILQLNVTALEARIDEELERNIVLESDEPASAATSTEETSEPTETPGEGEDAGSPESPSFDLPDRLGREYDLYYEDSWFPSRQRRSYDGERDAKMDAMANTAARPQSLAEHLLSQWALLDLDGETRRAGEAIIYSLEEDGYLRTHLEEVAEDTRPRIPVKLIEKALPLVQGLDPVGVAARDYQECLLVQLDALPGNNRIERELITNHLHDIARNRFPAVAKATGYTVGEISEAVKAISSTLHLHPAHLVIERQVPRITPDVIVEYADDSGRLLVRLTRGNTPNLRLSAHYQKLLKERNNGKDVRAFVRKHMENATALIDAINYRRSRLLDVAEAIVERQQDFFSMGPAGLRILRMSELAVQLECDPSTISRTVADKYMQTPRGIYPLRYFFTGGKESVNGESTSWDSVKARVKEIIEGEDRKAPLNDDQIAAVLESEELAISRRTVAKYRQQLAIPPARQRREY
ncbi:MAG TPA: RNA polymerase factor sigma-54 [Phycisphaerae bacterium]|nr:RNA polymerase factor sigma-54 [Phycisphaerae bacterium]